MDHTKPYLRRKPDVVIIQTSTNDLTENVNTVKKTKKLVNSINEFDHDNNTQIVISGITYRDDQDFKEKTNEINSKLKRYCDSKDMVFIDNKNIDESGLNRSWLHLNRKGTSLLSRNFSNFLKSV